MHVFHVRLRWPVLLIASLSSSALCVRAAGNEPDERRPNVLLLVADDLRPDALHAFGNPLISTPNLDRLVRAGTAFTRAVSPNPLCVPSRAEILTGCSGFRNGVLPGFSETLKPHLTLWPEAMRRGGYHTWYVGKWHTSGRPSTRGYEQSDGLFASGGPTSPRLLDGHDREITGYVGWVFQTDEGRLFPERGVGLTAEISKTFAETAIRFIERKPDRPFFLHVNFTAPHDPLIMPPGYEGRYDPADIPLPPNFLPEHPFDHGNLRGRDEQLLPWPRTPKDVRAELALYYAVISHLDEQVGRILKALEESGQQDNTIVIFTSDHGLAIGSHGLRGKQNMYEHTVGVPLILAGPGIPKGERRKAQVYLRDLFPTVCALAGITTPASVEGQSFVTEITNPNASLYDYIFGYFMDTQRMIRGDRWKLIHYPKARRIQLFDLVGDPYELNNLSDDPRHAAVVADLRTRLEAWQKQVGDPLLNR